MPDEFALRDFLKRAFQVDLPIRGGDGNEATPVVVAAPALPAAVEVMAVVLRCLGVARRIGWRLVDLEIVSPEKKLVRAGIETLQLVDQQYVVLREGVYFALDALATDSTSIDLPAPRDFVDPRSGVRLPTQLGWLHFFNATDDELQKPGLGSSVSYAGLRIEAMVSVYDNGQPLPSEDLADQRVVAEYAEVVSALIDASPGATVKHEARFLDPAGGHRCLMTIIDLPGSQMTSALLTTRRGCFVKARITFDATEAAIARMAHESIEAFVEAVRPAAARAS